MKRNSTNLIFGACILFALNLLAFNSLAQSPHKMSYQAVIRNSSFSLVTNSPVGIRVSILQTSSSGTAVYVETHTATTNMNGLATFEIGGGLVVSGSIATIDWAAGPYFLKTETDPAGGTSYTIVSNTQLLSTPYALYAKTSGSSTPGPQGPPGPQGDSGATGPQGPPGVLEVNCLECHNHDRNGPSYAGSLAEKRDRNSFAYEYSVHAKGNHNFYAGQNSGCAYCHSHEGFNSRVLNNANPTYTFNSSTSKWSYAFSAPAAVSSALPALPGKISCFTCHKGSWTDSLALQFNKDSVGLALWAMPYNAKFGKVPHDKASLTCLNCHQARPINYNTTSGNGSNVLDSLLYNLESVIYDSTLDANTGNKITPGYRTGGHYGWPGNIMLGVGFGPAEIPGSEVYENSTHSTDASCVQCHMATPTASSSQYFTGGHTFSAVNSFKGCNTSGCHTTMSATASQFVNARSASKTKLDALGELLKYNGSYLIMIDSVPFHENPEATSAAPEGNKWYKYTTKHFNGYFNIYDATYNPNAPFKAQNTNPAPFQKFPTLTKGQFACMIIFQATLREFSGGIHNPLYSNALLDNAIAYMTAHPF